MIRLAATACDAALLSWGALTLGLSAGAGHALLAVYVAAYGALNLYLIHGGARAMTASGDRPWLSVAAMGLQASLPFVFLGMALADRAAPLEWAGAALMLLPAYLNWRALRRAVGKRA